MTLNASGPISLGGSTVGQSINLELGNSATALASINSTQFRTLAGVPSGQISLSNFYGKSSNSYYLTYVGTNGSSDGSARVDNGFAVSASSGQVIVPFYWASYVAGIATLNSSGGLQAVYSTNGTGANNIRMPTNNYYSSDRVYIMSKTNTGLNYTTTASPSTFGWASQPCCGFQVFSDAYMRADIGSTLVVNSSGQAVTVGWFEEPKVGYSIGAWPANANGTQTNAGVWVSPGSGVANYSSIAMRTDGTPIVCCSSYFFVFPSNFTNTGSIQKYNTYVSNVSGAAMCDSSNNMWLHADDSRLCKYDASYSTMTKYSFITSAKPIDYVYGMYIYNDVIYMIGKANTLSNKQLFIWAVNASNSTVAWAKSITITNGTTFAGGNNFRSLVANASGIYLYLADSNAGNQMYVLKMPLAGNLTNTSYTLGGDTFTIATPTVSINTQSSTGNYPTSVSTFQQSAFSLQPSNTLTNRSGSALTSLTTTPVT